MQGELKLASDQGRQQLLDKVWLDSFKGLIVPQLNQLQDGKATAKTLSQLIQVLGKEQELCQAIQNNYWQVAQHFKKSEKNNHIQLTYASYKNKPELLDNIGRDASQAIAVGAMTESAVLRELSGSASLNSSAHKLFKVVQGQVLSNIIAGVKQLKTQGYVVQDKIRFTSGKEYLEHHFNDKALNVYLKGTVVEKQLAAIYQRQQQQLEQLQQQRQQELHMPKGL